MTICYKLCVIIKTTTTCDQVKQKIADELTTQSKPKKPVKWLAMPDPKNILELYYTLEPTKRLANKIAGLEDHMQFY